MCFCRRAVELRAVKARKNCNKASPRRSLVDHPVHSLNESVVSLCRRERGSAASGRPGGREPRLKPETRPVIEELIIVEGASPRPPPRRSARPASSLLFTRSWGGDPSSADCLVLSRSLQVPTTPRWCNAQLSPPSSRRMERSQRIQRRGEQRPPRGALGRSSHLAPPQPSVSEYSTRSFRALPSRYQIAPTVIAKLQRLSAAHPGVIILSDPDLGGRLMRRRVRRQRRQRRLHRRRLLPFRIFSCPRVQRVCAGARAEARRHRWRARNHFSACRAAFPRRWRNSLRRESAATRSCLRMRPLAWRPRGALHRRSRQASVRASTDRQPLIAKRATHALRAAAGSSPGLR